MVWLLIGGILLLSIVTAALVLARKKGPDTPKGPTIDRAELLEALEANGVDPSRRQTPAPDLLVPFIRDDEQLLGAVRAEVDGRKAIVVLLEDRLVSAEATLGHMGSQMRVLDYDDIDSVEHRTDIGGELRLRSGDQTHEFTHIPLRDFERFTRTLSERTSDE